MTTPTPYPERVEVVRRIENDPAARYLALPPPPELLLTEPTARLERGFFQTVAAVCDALSDAHALANMTTGDLRRLMRLGELAKEMLEERGI